MKVGEMIFILVLHLLTIRFSIRGNELTGFSAQILEDILIPTPTLYKKFTLSTWITSSELPFYNNEIYANGSITIPKDGIYFLTGNVIVKTQEANLVEAIWHNKLYFTKTFCKSQKLLAQNTTQTLSLGCFSRFNRGEKLIISIINEFRLNVMIGSSVGLQFVGDIDSNPSFSVPVPSPKIMDLKKKFRMNDVFSKDFNFYNSLTAFTDVQIIVIPTSGIYSVSLNVVFKMKTNSHFLLKLNTEVLESIIIEIDTIDTIVTHKTLLLQANDVIKFQYENMQLLSGGVYSITRLGETTQILKGISVRIPQKAFLKTTLSHNHFLKFNYLENSVQVPPYYFEQSGFLISHLNQEPKLIVKDFGVFLMTLQIDISMDFGEVDIIFHSVSETERSEQGLSNGLSGSFKSLHTKTNRFTLNSILQLRKNSPLSVTIKCKSRFSIRNSSYFSLTPIKRDVAAFFGYVKKNEQKVESLCQNKWIPLNGLYSNTNNTMSKFLSKNGNKYVVPTIGVYLLVVNALVKTTVKQDGNQQVHIGVFQKRFDQEKHLIADSRASITTESLELWILELSRQKSGDELELMINCTLGVHLLDDIKFEIYFLMHIEKSDYFMANKPSPNSLWEITSASLTCKKSVLLVRSSGVFFVSLSFLLIYKAIDVDLVVIEAYVFKNNIANLKLGLFTTLPLNIKEHNKDGFTTVVVSGFMELSVDDRLYFEVVSKPSAYNKYIRKLRDFHVSIVLFSEVQSTSVRFKTIEQTDKVFIFPNNIEAIENIQFSEEGGSFKSDSTTFFGPYMLVERSMFMMYDISVHLKNVIGEFVLCFRVRPRTSLLFISKKVTRHRKSSIILKAHGVINLTIGETVQLLVRGEQIGEMVICTRAVWSMVEMLSPAPQQPYIVESSQNSSLAALKIIGDYLRFKFDDGEDRNPSFEAVKFQSSNTKLKLKSELSVFYLVRDKPSLIFQYSLEQMLLIPFQHLYKKTSDERNASKSLFIEPVISLLIIESNKHTFDLVEIFLKRVNGEKSKLFEGFLRGKKTFVFGHTHEDTIEILKLTPENKSDLKLNESQQTIDLVLMPLKELSQTDGFLAQILHDEIIQIDNIAAIIGPWVVTTLPFFENSLGFKNDSSVFYVQENGHYLITLNLDIEFKERCELFVKLDDKFILIGDQRTISYTNMIWLEAGMTLQLMLKCNEEKIVCVKRLSTFSLILHASHGTFDVLSQNAKITTSMIGVHIKAQVFTNYSYSCSHLRGLLSDFKWIKDDQVILESKHSRTSILSLTPVDETYDGFYQCVMERGKEREETVFSYIEASDPRPLLTISNSVVYISENVKANPVLAIAFVKSKNSTQKFKLSITSEDGDKNFSLSPEETNDFSSIYFNGKFDYEIKQLYRIKIQIMLPDNKMKPVEKDISVHIIDENDNIPMFRNTTSRLLTPENIKVGSIVTDVDADDLDENTKLTFDIEKREDEQPYFNINKTNGEIMAADELDFEKIKEHNLLVSVHDGLHTSFKHIKIIVLDANDNKPEFMEYFYAVNVSLDTPTGARLLSLNATDKDSGKFGELNFRIATGNARDTFGMRQNEVILQHAVTEEQTFVLIVELFDGGDLKCEKEARVTVHFVDQHRGSVSIFDESVYNTTLAEAFDGEREVVRLEINSKVKNLQLTYGVDSLGKYENSHFYVNNEGVLMTNASIDFEKTNEFHVLVSACAHLGSGKLCSIAFVLVKVTDINDNYPQFQQERLSVNIFEDASIGDVIAKVSATDRDSINNGELYYSLSEYSDIFSIDKLTGVIFLTRSLNSSVNSEYNMTVMAFDQGLPSLSSYCSLNVNVLSTSLKETLLKMAENAKAPTFLNPETRFEVLENSIIGSLITKMTAADPDPNAKLTFGVIQNSNEPHFFGIDKTTGDIVTTDELDFEKIKEHNLLVSVHDGLHTSFKHIKIIVLDANDNKPEFMEYFYAVNVSLDTPTGARLLSLNATDKDSGKFGELNFRIATGNARDTFGMRQNEVILQHAVTEEQTFVLIVELFDGGDLKCEKEARVTVHFVDQHRGSVSIFDESVYNTTLAEAFDGEREVVRLEINSKVKNLQLTYGVDSLGKYENSHFYVNNEGVLMTNASIDFEKTNEFHVLVSACAHLGSGKLCSIAFVLVKVTDINDNYPQFQQERLSVNIFEDASIGDVIAKVSATDRDSINNGELYYSLSEYSDIFSIDKLTGVIFLTRSLNSSVNSEYNMTVMAFDQGLPSLSSYCSLNVNVLSTSLKETLLKMAENAKAPTFLNPETRFEVLENSIIGSLITKMTAADPDPNAKLTFGVIQNSNEPHFFGIDKTTGDIVTTDELDFEKIKEHNLLVSVHDGLHTSFKHIKIIVLDANDNKPEFMEYFYAVNVSLDTPTGARLLSLNATDKDSGKFGELNFRIATGNARDTFGMRQNEVILQHAVTEEQTFVLIVELFDGGDLKCEKEARVTVHFVDQHRGSVSIFDESVYNTTLAEAFDGEREVVRLEINSKVKNLQLTYGVDSLGKYENSHFYVNNEGVLMTNASIDFEKTNEFHVLVSACAHLGSGKLCSIAFVLVKVTDINDNYPQFQQERLSVNIFEDASIGDVIAKVSATDRDSINNGELYYSLSEYSDIFSIDKLTGVIFLTRSLNSSVNSEYNMTVMAFDQGLPSLSSYCSLNVNVLSTSLKETLLKMAENAKAPTFLNPETRFEVLENSIIGSLITKMTAADPDPNAKLTFGVIQNSNEPHFFGIDKTTGDIVTTDELDFEKIKEHNLLVSVHDGLHTSFKHIKIIVLDANDNKPEFMEYFYAVNVSLDTPTGARLLSLNATDKDSGKFGELNFRIATGNARDTFGMRQNEVILQHAVTEEQTFVLIVELFDGGDLKCEKEARVTVHFVDQHRGSVSIFDESVYNTTLAEAFDGEREVVRLEINSKVKNLQLTYGVDSLGKYENSHFYVNNEGVLMTNASIDFEKTNEFHVLVSACAHLGSGKLCSIAFVLVKVTDINDNYPQFQQERLSVNIFEDASIGDVIAKVSATDRDSINNGELYYSLSEYSDIFSIDKLTGVIFLTRSLNSSVNSEYNMTVMAFDQGLPSLSSYCSLNVNVLSTSLKETLLKMAENAKAPTFLNPETRFEVLENSIIGSLITKMTAADPDPNAKLTFGVIQNSNEPHFFGIDKTTGDIVTTDELDFEKIKEHNLLVSVHDGLHTSFKHIKIIVLDANDNKPEFMEYFYAVNVSLDTPTGARLLSLNATDKDSGKFGELNFRIATGNARDTFGMRQNEVILQHAVTEEQTFVLIVELFDGGDLKCEKEARVTVHFVDQHRGSVSIFDESVYNTTLAEAFDGEREVVRLEINSKVKNLQLTYGVDSLGKYENSHFYVNNEGVLMTNASIDFEKTNEFHVLVSACAHLGSGKLCSIAFVLVKVTDINDNYPQFLHGTVSVRVFENSPVRELITSVLATDKDSLMNGVISYRLTNHNDLFLIDNTTGNIFLADFLNASIINRFTIVVEAYDLGAPFLGSSFCTILVEVLPNGSGICDNSQVNMQPILILNSSLELFVPENSPIGTFVTKIKATVFNLKDKLSFGLMEVNEEETFFRINEISGELYTAGELDYEDFHEHFVLVTVKAGFYAAFQHVKITVINENDNYPEFWEYEYVSNIGNETSIGSELLTLKAFDKDMSGELIFQITSGNELNCFDVQINKVVLLCSINDDDFFILKVAVFDSGGLKCERDAQIIISANADRFNSISLLDDFIYKVRMLEKSGEESLIAELKLNPKLKNLPLTYKINTFGKYKSINFYVDTEGWLTTNASIDFEITKDFYVLVTACAHLLKYRFCGLAYVLINVVDMNDNKPQFSFESLLVNVKESTPVGSMVAHVTATDLDLDNNGEVFYTLWNYTDVFLIDNNGKLFLSRYLNAAIDKIFNITIEASDNGVPILSSFCNLIIKVEPSLKTTLPSQNVENKNPPFFLNTSVRFKITENSLIGTYVGTIKAFDLDLNSNLKYGLINFSNEPNFFKINEATGDLVTAKKIDFEKFQEHNVLVSAQDGLHTSFLKVKVDIIDENDNKPEFLVYSYAISLNLETPPGSLLLRLTATDKDSENNDKLEYKIISGNAMRYFSLKQNEIFLESYVNDEQEFELNVSVADVGGLESDRNAQVLITFENNAIDSFSLFDKYNYNGKMLEKTKGEIQIVQLELNSKLKNVEITYEVDTLGKYLNSNFYVDSKGRMMTNASLDFKKTKEFHILVTACAHLIKRRLCGLAYISITVVESNNKQFFSLKTSNEESSPVGEVIVQISSNGLATKNSEMFLTLLNFHDVFSIDRTTGKLFLIANSNFSSVRVQNVTIQITLSKIPGYSDVYTVAVKLDPEPRNETWIFNMFLNMNFFATAKISWKILIMGITGLVLILFTIIALVLHYIHHRPKTKEIQNLLKCLAKPAESLEASIYLSSESLCSSHNSSKVQRKLPATFNTTSNKDSFQTKTNGIICDRRNIESPLNHHQNNDDTNEDDKNSYNFSDKMEQNPSINDFKKVKKRKTLLDFAIANARKTICSPKPLRNEEKYILENSIKLNDIFDKIEEFEC